MRWQRWFGYYKTKLDSVVRRADDELDRREAELEVDAAERPWLHAGSRVPPTPFPTTADAEAAEKLAAFDLAKQQAAAEARLAAIRESLDIEDPPTTPR